MTKRVREIIRGKYKYELWGDASVIRTAAGYSYGRLFKREEPTRWSYSLGGNVNSKRYYAHYEELEEMFAELMMEKHLLGI